MSNYRITTYKTCLSDEKTEDRLYTERVISQMMDEGWSIKDVSVVAYTRPQFNGGTVAIVDRYVTLALDND